MIQQYLYSKGLTGIIAMTRPSDIPQDVWDNLSHELKQVFSKDYNRSFINPVVEEINTQIKKASDINRKINSKGNQLRSLTIEYIKNRSINNDQDMVQSQVQMVMTAQTILNSILLNQEELTTLLEIVTDRVNYYKEIDNVS